ncbi:energy-coupling factor transporter transmembrane component T family protein [Gemmatimonadota bacterium]
MQHTFLDRYGDLDSPLHRLDPRARIVAFTLALLIVVSVPPGDLIPFLLFYPCLVILQMLSRVPFAYILRRCVLITPFVLMAAGMMMLTGGSDHAPVQSIVISTRTGAAISIILKAYAAVILLSLLTSTGRFHRLLEGMRVLRMPPLLGVLSAFMYRYAFILSDEVIRTSRARLSRTPGSLRVGRFRTYGNQAATIFLRSWERSQTVYNAMCSRGFTGEFPLTSDLRLNGGDILFVILVPAMFVVGRLMA